MSVVTRVLVPVGGVGRKRRDDQVGPAVTIDVVAERGGAQAPTCDGIVRLGGADLDRAVEVRARIPILIGDQSRCPSRSTSNTAIPSERNAVSSVRFTKSRAASAGGVGWAERDEHAASASTMERACVRGIDREY